jgi:hypothetical protein
MNELHEVAMLYKSTKKELKEVEEDIEKLLVLWYDLQNLRNIFRVEAVLSKNLLYFLAVTSSGSGSGLGPRFMVVNYT